MFRSLVDACLVLRNGNGVEMQGKQWKPIVHKDICVINVFVTFPFNEDGTTRDYENKGRYRERYDNGVMLYNVDQDSVGYVHNPQLERLLTPDSGLTSFSQVFTLRFSTSKTTATKTKTIRNTISSQLSQKEAFLLMLAIRP
jgi:hypothetical protein